MPFKQIINLKSEAILIVTIIGLLTSCSSHRYLYYVPTPNNPTFSKKGDSKISAEGVVGMQGGVESDGGVFQGAYAISNQWAVAYGFDYRVEKSGYIQSNQNSILTSNQNINNYYNSSSVTVNRNSHEFAIGYFKSMNKLNSNIFSIYGGISIGRFNMDETGSDSSLNFYSRNMNCNLRKFFIQPAFTYHPNKFISFSVISKFSLINYHINNDNYTLGEKNYYKMNITNNDFFLDIEPTIYFSIGLKNIQFITSITLGGLLAGKPIDAISNNINGGLIFDIANIIRSGKIN